MSPHPSVTRVCCFRLFLPSSCPSRPPPAAELVASLSAPADRSGVAEMVLPQSPLSPSKEMEPAAVVTSQSPCSFWREV